MAFRWVAILALLMLLADTTPAFAAGGISYETEIDVPGDPALADQMKQISQLVARQGEADSELALQRRAGADITRLDAAARAAAPPKSMR